MRITVGGVLLVVGAGAVVALGPAHNMDFSFVHHQVEAAQKSIESLMGLFKKTESDSTIPVAVIPAEEPVAEVVAKPPEKVEVAPVAEVVPVVPVVPHAERVAAAIKRHRPKKRPSKRQGNVLTNAADKAAVAVVAAKPEAKVHGKTNTVSDPLMGTYVALKLKTGREVKGVLRGKTATQYTLELPGMGPFQYPAENVISVAPAE